MAQRCLIGFAPFIKPLLGRHFVSVSTVYIWKRDRQSHHFARLVSFHCRFSFQKTLLKTKRSVGSRLPSPWASQTQTPRVSCQTSPVRSRAASRPVSHRDGRLVLVLTSWHTTSRKQFFLPFAVCNN